MKKYRQYKYSGIEWMGEIPDHWKVSKVKFNINCIESGKREASEQEEILSIGGEHIGVNGKLNLKNLRYVSKDFYDRSIKGKVKSGDILMVKDGATIGKTAFVNSVDQPMLINEHVYRLESNKFMFYFCMSNYMQHVIWSENNSTAQEGINLSTIENISIAIPLKDEQIRIASFLDQETTKIDTLIAKQYKLIELLKEKRQAVISHAVTKGIRPDAAMLDTHIFDELVKNKELCIRLPKDIKYYVTHLQQKEISKIPDEKYRNEVQQFFSNITEEEQLPTTWVIGSSGLGSMRLADDNIKEELQYISNKNPKHLEDALILLEAKHQKIIVISNDVGTPFKRAKKRGYEIIDLGRFIKKYALKDSEIDWLGEIPEHWKVCSIKLMMDLVTDGAHISPETEQGVFNFVSTKDINENGINFGGCLKTSLASYEYLVKTGCKPLQGDVLFSKDGTIGRTVIIKVPDDFVVASSLIILRPNKALLDSNYLHYLCQSNLIKQQVDSFVKGAGLPRLSIQNLLKIVGTFPPIEEQKEIANLLHQEIKKFNTLINQTNESISLLQERRLAVISAAVTGKIDVRDFAEILNVKEKP